MEGEKLEELERALRSQLSEEKLKFIDKYRLQLTGISVQEVSVLFCKIEVFQKESG